MSCINSNILAGASGSAGAGGDKVYVDDVLSTYLYKGNGGNQTIVNGIDLAGEGGMVLQRRRQSAGYWFLNDTVNGANNFMHTSLTNGMGVGTSASSFNSNGFTIGAEGNLHANGNNVVSYTFRQAPGFFDVVTWTSSGSSNANRRISHSLGSVPGLIIVKRTDAVSDWYVYHRSVPNQFGTLNSTNAFSSSSHNWWGTGPTSTDFGVNEPNLGLGTGTFVAYIFAHDDAQFGTGGDESIIKCGTYTGNGSTQTINLGFEPQWVLIKRTASSGYGWMLWDIVRGMPVGNVDKLLRLNYGQASSEFSYDDVDPTPTGMIVKNISTSSGGANLNGATYIYMVIRRPNKPPEVGTDVFRYQHYAFSGGTNLTTTWPVDLGMYAYTASDTYKFAVHDRLRSLSSTSTEERYGLITSSTAAENTSLGTSTKNFLSHTFEVPPHFSHNNSIFYSFKRAPGFMDMVAYSGFLSQGATGTIPHNLTVAPELIIFKNRSYSLGYAWYVWTAYSSNTTFLKLNESAAPTNFGAAWAGGDANNINISYGHIATSQTGHSYIAYLFATLPGISKVGSYTGTGYTLNIDCGFTAGARFVLIKRTSGSGDWRVFDTLRGIVSGNDCFLSLNTTDAQTCGYDVIDPLNSGFSLPASGYANESGETYIFLAIA